MTTDSPQPTPAVPHWRDDAARRASRIFEAAHGREIEDRARGFRVAIEPRVALTVAIVLVIAVAVAWAVMWPRGVPGGGVVATSVPSAQATPVVTESTPKGSLWVHVSGEVEEPGLVELATGARVADALDAAGGARAGADLSAVNLARFVADGEQVHVPAAGEAAAGEGPVRLNLASAAQLEELPGIGPVLAERIVGDRDANGPFASLADLTRVAGVGDALVANLESLATV